eukprot:TRINITY_DN70230_c0_g1_i1.p1 TRINITY_DN70230_c0_g1~~TRINITY_DN70230_c0_g1_i1.p1  ORF type:complete len:319 (-),score=38.72 TRINITY_DN70230_c0_g1_i1:30-986(-)
MHLLQRRLGTYALGGVATAAVGGASGAPGGTFSAPVPDKDTLRPFLRRTVAPSKPRHAFCEEVPPKASWETLQVYAKDQAAEYAAGRGPQRLPAIDERYRRYFSWCKSRGMTGADYLVASAQWRGDHGGPLVAMEPNIVPYHVSDDIEHWNLWYHPGTMRGTADLNMQIGAEVLLIGGGASATPLAITETSTTRARICAVRWTPSGEASYDLRLEPSGIFVGRASQAELMPCRSPGAWAAVLRHVRIFLPSLREDEVVIWQNIPDLRSIPEVAHAHVFVCPRTQETREALQACRNAWTQRSPWAEHERLGGRGEEVGF